MNDWKKTVNDFIVSGIRKNVSAMFPDVDINFDGLKCDTEFAYHLNGFITEASTVLYSTSDSKRFETKTEKNTHKTEQEMDPVPATLKDHFKVAFLNFVQRKLHINSKMKWLHINYIFTKHVTIVTNNITNHITTLEYVCPHIKFPSYHQNHVLHLAQGIPNWRNNDRP